MVDQLVGHGCRDFWLRQVGNDASSQLDRDGRCGGNLQSHLHCSVVELITSDDAGNDSERKRFLSVERASGEHHVAHNAVPAHLEEATNTAGVGNDPMPGFGEHELRVV